MGSKGGTMPSELLVMATAVGAEPRCRYGYSPSSVATAPKKFTEAMTP